MLPAAFLRAFILEHLTKENVGRYQPELLLVDASDDEMAEGLLEVLDYSNDAQELKEFWPLFGTLRLRTDEAISFWKLVVGQSASGGGGAAARAGPAAGAARPRPPRARARRPPPAERLGRPPGRPAGGR